MAFELPASANPALPKRAQPRPNMMLPSWSAAAGLSNTEIAASRGTSARTVANQVASLLRKRWVFAPGPEADGA